MKFGKSSNQSQYCVNYLSWMNKCLTTPQYKNYIKSYVIWYIILCINLLSPQEQDSCMLYRE